MPTLPPAFTLPNSIDPSDTAAVEAFMESVMRARAETLRQRRLAGACEECGTLIRHPEFGCENLFDPCLEALLAQKRREAVRR